MKIDLHCHTRKIKSGDGVGREVTKELFRAKVLEANVKILAITNHNVFDYPQYNELKESVKDVCDVWPGVEIDVKDCAEKWHLIVVSNPNEVVGFSERVNSLFQGDNLETCTHTLDEIYSAFHDCDVLYISHFHKKPAISEEDREKLVELVGDRTRIFNETQDHRSMGVFANYDFNTLVGSDVKNWSEYEKCSFAELRLPVENFTQFCLLAKRDESVVDSLLNKKAPYVVQASPHESVVLSLKIYPDVNIIFGAKGTGKTEILSSLYRSFLDLGLRCEKSEAANRMAEFESLTNNQGMPEDLSLVARTSCEHEFKILKEWTDNNPTVFTRYIDWYTTRENNGNKRRMKITNAQEIQFDKPEHYDEHKRDISLIRNIASDLDHISIEDYIDEHEVTFFLDKFEHLRNSIYDARKSDIREELSIKNTNFSINKIKEIADRNTDSLSKPSSTGYRDFARSRLQLLLAAETILKNLEPAEKNEQQFLGRLEDKGDIFINSRYRILCDESRTNEFIKGIKALKEVKEKLRAVYSHVLDSDLAPVLDAFIDACEKHKIETVSSFLGRSKQIVTSDLKEYRPSNGEKGILLLQRILSKEADAYFLDEPELGMGNSYIDNNIRPLITKLGKQRKIVVVATHNANIAVRTLPYLSIYRTHKNGRYGTYIGNPFNDKLKNLEDPNDVLSWAEESMHSLEGSREAFYERRDIYESGC